MSDVWDIVQNNWSTYYNFRTGAPKRPLFQIVVILLVSAVMVGSIQPRYDNFYVGVLTAQAILAGFGFNVMIYLASARKIMPDDPDRIEDKNRSSKLNILSRELFYNVSYFNIVSFLSVLFSISSMIIFSFGDNIRQYANLIIQEPSVNIFIHVTILTMIYTFLYLFYAFTLESGLSFFRTIIRAQYFFKSQIGEDL